MADLRDAILKGNRDQLSNLLNDNPHLVNTTIPISQANPAEVHPIHFVCDRIFEGEVAMKTGEEIVRELVERGSDINHVPHGLKDTPLITASSLHCEGIAVYLLEKGADVKPKGTHGGTCLHWAAWTGAERVVSELLNRPMNLEDDDNEFKCSPLLWAIHGLLNGKGHNQRNQRECILRLVIAGARTDSTNADGVPALEILQRNNKKDLVDDIRSLK